MKRFPATIFAFIFFAALILSQHQLLSVESPKLAIGNADAQPIKLPYKLKSSGSQSLYFEATVYRHTLTTTLLRIIPDDCIETLQVNGQPINVTRLPGRCDWSHGAKIDLGPYLKRGENTIRIGVKKKDGIGGLNLFGTPDLYRPSHMALQFLAMLGLAGWLITLTRNSLSTPLSLLMASGALLQLHYLSYTDYATRTFDLLIATGHLDYIKMIAEHLTLPNPTQGWEYHQPPLYYLLAAAVYAIFTYLPVLEPLVALQMMSMALFILFLYFSLRSLTMLVADRRILFVASALLIFWPSGIIHSIRIGNDILFFTLFAAGVYAILQWQLRQRPFWPALLIASLALITKANGIILFGVIGILMLVELYRARALRGFFRQTGIALLYFLAAFLINFADNIYYVMAGNGSDWLVSNVVNTINKKLYVANEAFNYLYFDIKTYLSEPFINPWDDRYGRQYFWNYLFKSALFSEFFFTAKHTVATVMGAVSLFIFGYILLGLAAAQRNRGSLIMGLTLFVSLAALLIYRIKIPVACNTDFRYIYPVVLPMAFFFARGLTFLKQHELYVAYYTGIGASLLFSLGSIAVFY